jgi:hypothetical protein
VLLGPLLVLAAGATAPEPPSESHLEPEPDSSAVESVILLLGDAGEARLTHSPILPRVRAEVERWAGVLERDSAVVVALLGDIVYPAGVREPGSPEWPMASARGARALFLAGNHDWGERRDHEGAVRLLQLDELLDGLHARGLAVDLLPAAGTGGPAIVDVGEHLRLVLLDTAWWLLAADSTPRAAVLGAVADALASAEGRDVIMAAHHPFASGGPHGGVAAVGRVLGIKDLLSRSGALLQDLDSRPYLEFRQGLLRIFAEHGPPAVFAGGHEHSIQLLRGQAASEPLRALVSGSASKLTDVGLVPGMLFARSEPGFARILVLRDGSLHLTIETAPSEFLRCPDDEPLRIRCMADGVAAYRVVWSESLATPSASPSGG